MHLTAVAEQALYSRIIIVQLQSNKYMLLQKYNVLEGLRDMTLYLLQMQSGLQHPFQLWLFKSVTLKTHPSALRPFVLDPWTITTNLSGIIYLRGVKTGGKDGKDTLGKLHNPTWGVWHNCNTDGYHLKFNSSPPENIPSQKESSLPTIHFSGASC